MKVSIYVEGGGTQQDILTECRRGFAEFIGKMIPNKAKPKVIACGSRSDAFRDFRIAVRQLKFGERAILLVDSEDPVAPDQTVWEHLKARTGDHWEKPEEASDEDAYLMVQCMEAWFLADPNTLAAFYKKDFRKSKLPKINDGIESISKDKIKDSLIAATRDTQKGTYHKTKHGFALLALIDPNVVIAASDHVKDFRDKLNKWLDNRRDY